MNNNPFEEFCLPPDDTGMPVIRIGNGKKTLLVITGMSLLGIEGQGTVMAQKYRCFTDDYTVFVLDRRKELPEGYGIGEMAEDVYRTAVRLGIGKADVYGISQGGMIAQQLTARHPEMVHALALCSTAYHVTREMKETIGTWVKLAEEGNVTALNMQCYEKIFSEGFLRKYEKALRVLAGRGDREECCRFAILGRACLDYHGEELLKEIRCPLLVIAGAKDLVLGTDDSRVLAEKAGAQLLVYEGYGHSVYDEVPEMGKKIYEFFSCQI